MGDPNRPELVEELERVLAQQKLPSPPKRSKELEAEFTRHNVDRIHACIMSQTAQHFGTVMTYKSMGDGPFFADSTNAVTASYVDVSPSTFIDKEAGQGEGKRFFHAKGRVTYETLKLFYQYGIVSERGRVQPGSPPNSTVIDIEEGQYTVFGYPDKFVMEDYGKWRNAISPCFDAGS